jgi:hypothetical protein
MDTDRIVSAIEDLAHKFHGPLIDQKDFYERVLEMLKTIDGRLAVIEYNSGETWQAIHHLNRDVQLALKRHDE